MELQAMLSDLNETFPPVNPTPTDSHALVMYRAGQRSVVEYIFNKWRINYVYGRRRIS